MVRAHRYSYEFCYGKIPKGVCVLHKCDNPSCIRPDHLFLGTQKDNIADRHQKDRDAHQPGENHGMAKLTDEQALEIFERRRAGEKGKYLAQEFKVSQATVSEIFNRRHWTHLQVPVDSKSSR